MALRMESVETLSVGKSKDVPVGCRRFILCNSGEEVIYFRPSNGAKATEKNAFPLYPQEKTEVMTAENLALCCANKGEAKMLYVKEE